MFYYHWNDFKYNKEDTGRRLNLNHIFRYESYRYESV